MIRLIRPPPDGTASVNRSTVENMVVNQNPSVHTFLHYYEIVKYSSILTGLLKICKSSEIDHI